MTKDSRKNRISEIIRRFYEGQYDPTAEDLIKKKFMHWIKQNRESADIENVVKELWDVEEGDSVQATEQQLNNIMQRIGFKEEKPAAKQLQLRSIMMKVAAAIIPLLIMGGLWIITNKEKPALAYTSEWSIPNGEIEQIGLPDSSSITINAGSKLNISQDSEKRVAKLTGESYFKVAKDENRPFIVETDDIKINVLGTEFNVEAYPEREITIVTLIKGKIDLETPDNKKYVLTPNEQLLYNKLLKTTELKMLRDANSAFGWTQGELVCELLTLPEIFKKIERFYNISIEIDPTITFTDMKYTMVFGSEVTYINVIESLKLLTEAYNYDVTNERQVKIKNIKAL